MDQLPFFHAKSGLWKGWLFSPLVFILVAEGLRKMLGAKKIEGSCNGIHISQLLYIIHILFMDEIMIFFYGKNQIFDKLKSILYISTKCQVCK